MEPASTSHPPLAPDRSSLLKDAYNHHLTSPLTCDLRGPSIPAKRHRDAQTARHSAIIKSTPSSIHNYSRPAIYPVGYWSPPKGGKVRRLERDCDARIELHQSTCLNIAGADSVEGDLWILPDFEEWEDECDGQERTQMSGTALKSVREDGEGSSEWAPLVERAVNSNRERLRRRLEGDGWDFVGGRYGEDGSMSGIIRAEGSEEESVDEEFDVVILPSLPMVKAGCA